MDFDRLIWKSLINCSSTLENETPGFLASVNTVSRAIKRKANELVDSKTVEIFSPEKLNLEPNGYYAVYVNVDSRTSVCHTEKDFTYTILNVPKQENME